MRLLLMAGFGPYSVSFNALDGTLFSADISARSAETYRRWLGRPFEFSNLRYEGSGISHGLLRPVNEDAPHLTSAVVRSILEQANIEHETFDLEGVWSGAGEPEGNRFDVVGLSTTFICDPLTLGRVIRWIDARFPEALLLLGGQYSNLKYATILDQHPEVDYVIRGDAELALPKLLQCLQRGETPQSVPNLAGRDSTGKVITSAVEYIGFDRCSRPVFHGQQSVVPYKSMRGCPFFCKFCSYPAASPEWRYKSTDQILDDWRFYARENGAKVIRSLDSTFTVPAKRFGELLNRLPELGVGWEAYARANAIRSADMVQQLENAHCKRLFIGFELMQDATLQKMDKRVTAANNVRAVELLSDSAIELRGGFIVGYPGETPEDFDVTRRYLAEQYIGRFGLHPFTLIDETMPVWEQANEFQIEVTNPLVWKHVGMTSKEANALRDAALYDIRWKNDNAVSGVWQLDHQRPLVTLARFAGKSAHRESAGTSRMARKRPWGAAECQ